MFRATLCSSSGEQLYEYNFWYNQCVSGRPVCRSIRNGSLLIFTKIIVFWNLAPRSLADKHRRFRRYHSIHFILWAWGWSLPPIR